MQAAVRTEKSASLPLRGRVDPRTLATQVRFSQVMAHKLANLRRDLDAVAEDLALAQAALIEAAKGRKVLRSFRKSSKRRWIAEQQKRRICRPR